METTVYKYLSAAFLAMFIGTGAAHAATLTGDHVNLAISTQSGGTVYNKTFDVGKGFDVGFLNSKVVKTANNKNGKPIRFKIDLDRKFKNGQTGFVMSFPKGMACGVWICDGGTTTFTLSNLDFSDGEKLVGFNAYNSKINPSVKILNGNSISFSLLDKPYSDGKKTLFYAGEFVTVAAIPLPATGLMLGMGLLGLGWTKRRRMVTVHA